MRAERRDKKRKVFALAFVFAFSLYRGRWGRRVREPWGDGSRVVAVAVVVVFVSSRGCLGALVVSGFRMPWRARASRPGVPEHSSGGPEGPAAPGRAGAPPPGPRTLLSNGGATRARAPPRTAGYIYRQAKRAQPACGGTERAGFFIYGLLVARCPGLTEERGEVFINGGQCTMRQWTSMRNLAGWSGGTGSSG